MSNLFHDQEQKAFEAVQPLPVRLRPRTFDEFAGQLHFLGPGKLLRRMLDSDRLTSVIFTGPPGTGKTALAELIARHTGRHFERSHAALTGVKEIRTILADAADRLTRNKQRTILFLDEIHRFARNQQDVLLSDVESGLITLIGATTENPYFAVNSALVSRSTVFRFEPLSETDIATLLRRALTDPRAFAGRSITIDDDAVAHLARISDGDARRALTALEVAVLSTTTAADQPVHITLETAVESIQSKAINYDATGDQHYDFISGFIKAMRASNADSAITFLATMLEAGEDPRFIARRIAIFASEDIGNADPNAINVAASAWHLTERIGMPECQLTLAQATLYMANAPKSNAAATAIWTAMEQAKTSRTAEVPSHWRDSLNRKTLAAEAEKGTGVKAPEKYISPHHISDGMMEQDRSPRAGHAGSTPESHASHGVYHSSAPRDVP